MKKTYHLCLSAGDEILFRDEEDYNRGFNSFALALYKTDSTGLVESFQSTHCHLMIQAEDPSDFMFTMRQSYSKYFNRKYMREGRVGEKHHFALEVVGLYHHLAAMSYVLRNALHHGVVPIPYAYPHCSVNAVFQKEMGKRASEKILEEKVLPESEANDLWLRSFRCQLLKEKCDEVPIIYEKTGANVKISLLKDKKYSFFYGFR